VIDRQQLLAVVAERRPGKQEHDAHAGGDGEINAANGGLQRRLYGPSAG
jgi:hypothetical protein